MSARTAACLTGVARRGIRGSKHDSTSDLVNVTFTCGDDDVAEGDEASSEDSNARDEGKESNPRFATGKVTRRVNDFELLSFMRAFR